MYNDLYCTPLVYSSSDRLDLSPMIVYIFPLNLLNDTLLYIGHGKLVHFATEGQVLPAS